MDRKRATTSHGSGLALMFVYDKFLVLWLGEHTSELWNLMSQFRYVNIRY